MVIYDAAHGCFFASCFCECTFREDAFSSFSNCLLVILLPHSVFIPVSQLKLASLHEDYRACTKHGCRHTGGWVCMCTRRGMGSAPIGWREVARVGIGRGTFVRARKFVGSIQWHRGARRVRIVYRAGGSNRRSFVSRESPRVGNDQNWSALKIRFRIWNARASSCVLSWRRYRAAIFLRFWLPLKDSALPLKWRCKSSIGKKEKEK